MMVVMLAWNPRHNVRDLCFCMPDCAPVQVMLADASCSLLWMAQSPSTPYMHGRKSVFCCKAYAVSFNPMWKMCCDMQYRWYCFAVTLSISIEILSVTATHAQLYCHNQRYPCGNNRMLLQLTVESFYDYCGTSRWHGGAMTSLFTIYIIIPYCLMCLDNSGLVQDYTSTESTFCPYWTSSASRKWALVNLND